MTRRIQRGKGYELTLQVSDEGFMATPRPDQRQWLLSRILRETGDELEHADVLSRGFVRGEPARLAADRAQLALSDDEIMEDWQVPIMRRMAAIVAGGGGDVLEVGMGRGVAADFIQQHAPRSHTLVECNAHIVARFETWRERYPGREITLLPHRWQDCLEQMTRYDGLLFHTYPTSQSEFVDQVVQSVTFAGHFFDTARNLLRPGGRFSYLSNEIDSLGRAHQRALLQRFSEVRLSVLADLDIPDDTRDSHWARQMVIVEAVR